MRRKLSPQESYERAFHEDELGEEDIYKTEAELAPTPKKVEAQLAGMLPGETLELAGDGDAAAAACRESGDDALFEEFFHD